MRIWSRDPESFLPRIRDPGWIYSDPGSGIQDEHPGSATLSTTLAFGCFPGGDIPILRGLPEERREIGRGSLEEKLLVHLQVRNIARH